VPDPTGPIELTTEERDLFTLILAADRWAGLGQTYRVAGGWVRDKLLGGGTVDIDFALDRTTGVAFLDTLRAYIDAHRAAGFGILGERVPSRPLRRGYVVQQNAEKSKHLETAGVRLFGISAEFVHLRSERYAESSRVPKVEFGDAASDAARRDLTINALFYRLDSGEIEDFVGGLGDLRRMLLRTPLDPLRTFIDDPLRVLRVLRFFSRFPDASIDPETERAMARAEVHEAYERKLSPERGAAEVLKLFGGAKPERAALSLARAGLAPVVFRGAAGRAEAEVASSIIARMMSAPSLAGASDADRALALLAAWLWVAMGAPARPPGERALDAALKPIGVGKSERLFVRAVTRGVAPAAAERWDAHAMGRLWQATHEPGLERDDAWRFALDLASAALPDAEIDASGRRRAMEAYAAGGVLDEPLLSGDELMEAFPDLEPRSGFIREIHRRLIDRQLAGEITTADAARGFVDGIAAEVRREFGRGN